MIVSLAPCRETKEMRRRQSGQGLIVSSVPCRETKEMRRRQLHRHERTGTSAQASCGNECSGVLMCLGVECVLYALCVCAACALCVCCVCMCMHRHERTCELWQ